MKFCFGKQDFPAFAQAQDPCVLLTNGLGGYSSVTAAFSAPRGDQGLLVAAVQAPNVRINLVHRMGETLRLGLWQTALSSQDFADGTLREDGWRHLSSFTVEYGPRWLYEVRGVQIERRLSMARMENTVAVSYRIENGSDEPCTLDLTPFFKMAPKEQPVEKPFTLHFDGKTVSSEQYRVNLFTDGCVTEIAPQWQSLCYSEDAKDGRPDRGLAGGCFRISKTVQPGEHATLDVVFSTQEASATAEELWEAQQTHLSRAAQMGGFHHPVARQLAQAADAFLARRDSTGGMTILAGYPLFSDWGRDTMIALPGCALATGRMEDAKSIIRTFLAYEKDGLVPNLFPEGETKPMYNTADAALLLIDAVWQVFRRTGEVEFVRESWPVMERIIRFYRTGTHHGIAMEDDGLIRAGKGLDQVTWMDVCVNGILPTPRHGKPVEINAYWYNALRIMQALAPEVGASGEDYGALAELVKQSFVEKFYLEDRGYLRDVISGTKADEQLRCNQIWAVSMDFTMLSPQQERQVVDAVTRHLYTPCGLRTLSPEDPEYHGTYGGPQVQRDMAYHQGTVWVFPLGAYYRAWLKTHGATPQAARTVTQRLEALEPMLRQGCVGQLPEIYDGDFPTDGKGCFAQAWSVGELLRVYETLKEINEEPAKA